MLADIRRGHISGLVFSKLARLARNRRELDEIAEIFQEHDADLVSITDNIDTSTALGRMALLVTLMNHNSTAPRNSAPTPCRSFARLPKVL
jgi:site-specific DNA recombinase